MAEILKRRLYNILEIGDSHDLPGRLLRQLLVVLILVNVAAVAAETVPWLRRPYGTWLDLLHLLSLLVFTLEYLVRAWVCTEHSPLGNQHPWQVRLRHSLTAMALIDLASVAPFWLAWALTGNPYAFGVTRLVLMFKLARFSTALGTLGRVLANEWRALVGAALIMMGLLMLASTVMYYIERGAQPEVFTSIPAAMWWAMSAVSTVGYGDVVPVTSVGRFVAGLVTVFGIGTYALPVGIIATGFATEIQRRDFVVSWGMVARVPLFAGLDAVGIARISSLLRSRIVPPAFTIVRRGDAADCMYLIAGGEVEVEVSPNPVKLAEGDFFGEMALLQDTTRNATVVSLTRCQLMILDAADFRKLLQTQPGLRDAIQKVVAARAGPAKPAAPPPPGGG